MRGYHRKVLETCVDVNNFYLGKTKVLIDKILIYLKHNGT